ncbi:NF038132 family protein [Ideonella sp. A 288]|uniref:NF038132 family protein n=1 Tax=Ideonella sp. A 288 TaxID=1962181 RepID=UPI000B4B030B|nr:NF038132 family protein [Ideonella sp. A 288]
MKPTAFTRTALAALVALSFGAAQAAPIQINDLTWTIEAGAAGLVGSTNTVPLSPSGSSPVGFVTTDGGVTGASALDLKKDGKGTREETNGSAVRSSTFTAANNDTLTMYFNYVSTDGGAYGDYAWARLVDASTNDTAAWLFTARSSNSSRGQVVPGGVLGSQEDNSLLDEMDAVLNGGNTIDGTLSTDTDWAPLGGDRGTCWDNSSTCGATGWIQSDYRVRNNGSYYLEFGVMNWGDEAYQSALGFDFNGLRTGQFQGFDVLGSGGSTPLPEPQSLALVLVSLALLRSTTPRRRSSARA